MQVTNIGNAFPLEGLASDISRNSYNYQSILNGLIDWNVSSDDTVNIRLATDVQPWYQDFQIPTKKSVFASNTYLSSQKDVVVGGNFAISSQLKIAVYGGTAGSSYDVGDLSLTRISIKDAGGTQWQLYYTPVVTTWTSGISVRAGNYFDNSTNLYIALNSVTSTTNPSSDTTNFTPYVTAWTQSSGYSYGRLVSYSGSLYIVNSTVGTSVASPVNDSSYTLFAPAFVSGTYSTGSYVFFGNYTYMSTVSTSAVPGTNSDWIKVLILPVQTAGSFNQSCIVRMDATVDISSFIVRNVSIDSTSTTEFYVQESVKPKANPSIFQRSTEVFSTSNYTMFPTDTTAVWDSSTPITSTDDSLSISTRQPYSASMVFSHADQTNCKTINYVNYDGPDLDQGLCIYLPVEITLEDTSVVSPEDGFTYEFYFRIWPDVNLTTNTVTRDHIVNKSQIYVYSAPDGASAISGACSTPIAKFSMARMTNFYIFAENIAIPDKPVVYRATFMYSASQNAWLTYDYYQMPDHVFMGPVGYIDPQNPGNLDVNGLNGINPDANHLGYETCAFPAYVDVFSNPDLSPYKSSDGAFYNRSV